jgi:FlaA1/EpsC-like NDP-sugar epimerase
MVRLRRQIGITVEQFWFLTLGGLLAYWLNWAIIPLVMPASVLQTVFFALVGLGFVLLLFIVYLFQMYKEFSNYVKGRMIFLGASFVSLMLASFAFFGVIVMIYTPNTEMSTMIFANIFKSILLASLFSFFERLLRFLEDQKERKRGHVQLSGVS